MTHDPRDPEDAGAAPAPHSEDAPPAAGGAYDGAVELVTPGTVWADDAAGYPPEPDDPGRYPESEGMAEDPPSPPAPFLPPAVPEKPKKTASSLSLPGFDEIGVHLEELRKRLFICLSVFIPFFALGLYFYRDLWNIIIHPLEKAAPGMSLFQALAPSDGLLMAMRISFAFALFLSLPVWLSQVWSFISPGLTARERRFVHLSLGSGGVLFCVGAAAAYFVGIPYGLAYLLPFNQSLAGWENSFTGTGYVDFVITCCAGFGLAFELPLVMLALGVTGILSSAAIREWWRVIILLIFVLAALMTPPDPFTQMLLALPMLVLFYVGYWLVKWAEPKE